MLRYPVPQRGCAALGKPKEQKRWSWRVHLQDRGVYLRHVHIRIDIGREEGTQHVHRNKARSHVCRTPDRSQAPPEQ